MKIGVCGTGTIASWMSDTICQLNDPNLTLYACATSPGFDAKDFAEKYGYEKICASFDELMSDPEVDLVYLGVPNQLHHSLSLKAIQNGKNLVCEKPMSVREEECKAVIRAAEERGVFFSEALWQNFLPAHRMISEEIAAGTIGEIKAGKIVMLDNVMFLDRVKHLESGGGVLLDEGPYSLGIMVRHFGTEIASVSSEVRKLDTGVDAEVKMSIRYTDGRVVDIHQRMDTPEEEHCQYFEIIGSNGRIRADAIANPRKVEVFNAAGALVKTFEAPPQITFRGMPPVSGYEHEWLAYERAVRANEKACAETSHEMSLAISHVMDTVLNDAGIVFPF